MALTTASNITESQWSEKLFKEYVRATQFSSQMGTNENAAIQLVEDLTKKRGDNIRVPLALKLSNTGVTGDSTLEGNEEALTTYNHTINVDQLRNAVAVGQSSQQDTSVDLLEAGRAMLKLWAMDQMRDDIIQALQSANVDGVTAYASCTEGQKDTWVAAQYAQNRVLFGAARSNYSTSDHSASLLNVDSTSDKLTAANLSHAKRYAKSASIGLRPIRVDGKGEWFILYAGSYPFRDLKSDLAGEHQDAGVRGKDNPLFNDGDIMWDGVVVKEVPEIGVISGVGNSSIDVGANFLCGAQAVGIAWAKRTHPIFETRDYGNIKGVGVAEIRGVEKLTFNSVQHGVQTLYTSAVADT
jgi:N4-gp56 family major capsid protein